MNAEGLKRFLPVVAALLIGNACGDDPGSPVLTPTTIATIQPAPDTCTLGVPTELSALVTDVNGTPVPGVAVTFAVETGNGTTSPPNSTTNGDGIATTIFTCGAPVGAGPTVVVATFDGVQQNNARWPLVPQPGTLVLLDFAVFLRPDSIPIAVGYPKPLGLVGLMRDGFGGSPPGTVTWDIVSGGGSLSQHSTEAFSCSALPYVPQLIQAWCANNSWTLGAGPGLQAIQLSSPDAAGFEQPYHVRMVTGPLTIMTEPASDISGEAGSTLPAPLVVRILAGDGSPIPRVLVRFGAIGGELEPVNPADTAFNFFHVYTDGDGRAAMRYTLPTKAGLSFPGAAPYMLAENGEAPTASWSLNVLPGPPASLSSSGSDQSGSVGQPLGNPLVVGVEDRFGNAVAGQSVTWVVTSGGGSLAQSTTTSETGGHQNTWTLGPTPGTQTATASLGGMTVTFTAHASGS
jgi:hypothetical protein